jgi:hypothetical protein
MVAFFKVEYRSGKIWPVVQHYMLKARNSRHVYAKVCIVQTALAYSSITFYSFRVNETRASSKLTALLRMGQETKMMNVKESYLPV